MLASHGPDIQNYIPSSTENAVSRIWTKARYKATIEDIRACYTESMIDVDPEVRASAANVRIHGGDSRNVDRLKGHLAPHPERPPAIDRDERYLVECFLRRYIAYCAGRRYCAAMQGTAALLGEVRRTIP